MPALQGVGNCQYTALTTAGTTTLNASQSQSSASGPPSGAGVFYGFYEVAPGTNFAATALDIVVAGTNTTTTTLANGTGTANQFFGPAGGGIGVRYRGALVSVQTGTPGQINALWD